MYKETQQQPPSIAEIVRQETDNGRIIVEFLLDVVQGKIPDATPRDRQEARDILGTFWGQNWDMPYLEGGTNQGQSSGGPDRECPGNVPKCPRNLGV